MRRFELIDGTSSKFWSPLVEGTVFTVVFGKIGTGGQRREKHFGSEEDAEEEMNKKIAEKLREGYSEVGGVAPPSAPITTSAPVPTEKAKKTPAAPAGPPPLAPRHEPGAMTAATRAAALTALQAVAPGKKALRSWRRAKAIRKAVAALRATAMIKPADVELGAVLKSWQRHGVSARELVQVLWYFDASAVDEVKAAGFTSSAAKALAALDAKLGNELALRVAHAVLDDRLPIAVAQARLLALRSHVEHACGGASGVASLIVEMTKILPRAAAPMAAWTTKGAA
jgi:predicted DNA-binding WGR domain protein